MISIRTRRTVGVVTVAVLALGQAALLAGPAQAKGGDDVRVVKSGSCSERGTWKLKAKTDDDRIEWEFEVDTNKAGQKFVVKVSDNGRLIHSGTRTTVGKSGSFSLERTTADRSGKDVIRARATRGSNVCFGSVSL